MSIAIFTHDLTEFNAHLLPWRTVLEIGSFWNKQGIETVVFSGTNKPHRKNWFYQYVRIIEVPKPKNKEAFEYFAEIFAKENISCLYYPLSWISLGAEILKLESNSGLKVVWYIPGAWYHLRQVMVAARQIGVRSVLPYIAQALMPRRFYVKRLTSRALRPVITMSGYVKDKLIACGYPGEYVHAIVPGKATPVKSHEQSELFSRTQKILDSRPYFLFFGPPQAIRGIEQVLDAFRKIAATNQNICLVCLFRSDNGIQTEKLQSRIKKMGLQGRLICIWQSVSMVDLDAFLTHCYAVLKPFLLVPSEIPLAVIEAAGYGKPVISTGPDGTGLFASQFGLMVPPGDARALAEAMSLLLTDKELYSEKCLAASRIYNKHPTWDEVAAKWLAVGGAGCANHAT